MNSDPWLWLDLFWRFMLVSLLAFGGGQAALPLVERVAVKERGWVGEQDFAAAVGCGYVTPGPVLITATFIGYRVGGLVGATAATVGVFLMPSFLATVTARLLRNTLHRPRLRGFARGAAAAVVGLLALTCFDLARHACTVWAYSAVSLLALAFSLRTKVHPALILIGGAIVGAVVG
jgi:chromate transporter